MLCIVDDRGWQRIEGEKVGNLACFWVLFECVSESRNDRCSMASSPRLHKPTQPGLFSCLGLRLQLHHFLSRPETGAWAPLSWIPEPCQISSCIARTNLKLGRCLYLPFPASPVAMELWPLCSPWSSVPESCYVEHRRNWCLSAWGRSIGDGSIFILNIEDLSDRFLRTSMECFTCTLKLA